mmetsp:Transcript_24443/g.28294  ORF Transcript_24443/g.28294 Transcript_24443/m.28294 type:complete len:343 (+) Transcript_24443:124-1152(+)
MVMNASEALSIQECSCTRPYSDLLVHVLQFFSGSPSELSKARPISKEFKRSADFIITSEIEALLGPSIKPIHGQSPGELLAAAIELDEKSIRWIRSWDANTSRKNGFDVGVVGAYTMKRCGYDIIFDEPINVIALIPCMASSSIPVGIQFDKTPSYNIYRPFESINNVFLPRKFLHMNKDECGEFYVYKQIAVYHKERALNDTLKRVRKDILNYDFTGPEARSVLSVLLHSPNYGGLKPLYDKYFYECLKIFENFRLGHRMPDLNVLESAIHSELKLRKMQRDYLEKMEEQIKSATAKIERLENNLKYKYDSEAFKRTCHCFLLIALGFIALVEKIYEAYFV